MRKYEVIEDNVGKKIRYWAMCFVLDYIENG